MLFLFLTLALLPALSWGQAAPSPATGDARIRYAVGQTIRETIRTNYPAANDNQIDKTIQRVGQVMGDAANNPQYQANATRWAWIGFRLMQRANPWVSIALELCAWQGTCTPNKKLDIWEIKENDAVITQYVYELPYPMLGSGLIYFAGKSIPVSSFTCGGTDSFIANFELYWPGLGDPCRVQAGFPSAINAHQIYLSKYGKDYFGFENPQDFDYSQYYLNTTLPQILATPAIVCRSFGTGSGTYSQKLQNPYWPCISKALDQPAIDSLLIYNGGSPIPYTWKATVKTTDGQNIKIVTDFPMTDLQLYPDAPEKGRIDLYPWLQSLTATDLVPALSPEWVQQVATAAWLEAMQNPLYDGLPFPDDGVSPTDLENALSVLGNEWPTIGDMVDPIENNQTEPYYKKNNNPAKTYRFNWSCGFSNMPKCIIDFIVSGTSSGLDLVGISHTPFDPFSVDSFSPANNFSAFLNNRFSGASCIHHPASAYITGQTRTINWDFCKFAGVARDVLGLLAYIATAGVLFGGLRTSRQERK